MIHQLIMWVQEVKVLLVAYTYDGEVRMFQILIGGYNEYSSM